MKFSAIDNPSNVFLFLPEITTAFVFCHRIIRELLKHIEIVGYRTDNLLREKGQYDQLGNLEWENFCIIFQTLTEIRVFTVFRLFLFGTKSFY